MESNNEQTELGFDETLKQLEQENKERILELYKLFQMVSCISSLLVEECDIDGDCTFFTWYYRKGLLHLDVISNELQFVDWEGDRKTTLALEGLAHSYEMTWDWYISETERKKLDARIDKLKKEKGE